MADDWITTAFGALADSVSVTHAFDKEALIFLNTSDIFEGKILHSRYSPIKDFPGQAKKTIREGDILFSEIRPANGRYAFIDFEASDYVVSTKLMVIRARDQISPRYLYHFLTNKKTTTWLQHLAESRSGTFPQITFSEVSALSISIPSNRHAQDFIANFFDAFDDKIELNSRMNETLEAIAHAIFKSWFVDFDPVRAKASREVPESICRRLGLTTELLTIFPDHLVNSELGEIPAGWDVTTLGELCERVSMGPFGSDIKTSNFVAEGVPIIRGGNLTAGFVDDKFVFLTEAKADELRNANARAGDIVITHRGTLGQVGLIPSGSRYSRYVVSQSQMVLTVKKEKTTSRFIYEYLRSPVGLHALLANTSQVGVPAIARPTTSVKAILLLAPPLNILHAFESLVGSLFDVIDGANRESATLRAIRDTLLPKLLSGELRAPIMGLTDEVLA